MESINYKIYNDLPMESRDQRSMTKSLDNILQDGNPATFHVITTTCS